MTAHYDPRIVVTLDATVAVSGNELILTRHSAQLLLEQLAVLLEPKMALPTLVAAHFGLTEKALQGQSHHADCVLARRFSYLLLHEQGMNNSEIARRLHHDHASVGNGLRKLAEDLSCNVGVQRRLDKLRLELQAMEEQKEQV